MVISIIALLISLLLPALGGAMRAAQSVACLSNLHQLGLGDSLYAEAYHGAHFTAYEVVNQPGGGQLTSGWPTLLNPYITTGLDSNNGRNQDSINSVYTCPSAYNPHYPPGSSLDQYLLTYGVNCNVHTWGNPDYASTPARTLVYITQIRRPSEIIDFADCAQSSGVWTCAGWISATDSAAYGGWYNAQSMADLPLPILGNADVAGGLYGIRYRHDRQNATNVVFCDGHATTARIGTLLYRNISNSY